MTRNAHSTEQRSSRLFGEQPCLRSLVSLPSYGIALAVVT